MIWGAPEGTKIEGRQEKIFVGALSPVPELKEKEDMILNEIEQLIKIDLERNATDKTVKGNLG